MKLYCLKNTKEVEQLVLGMLRQSAVQAFQDVTKKFILVLDQEEVLQMDGKLLAREIRLPEPKETNNKPWWRLW